MRGIQEERLGRRLDINVEDVKMAIISIANRSKREVPF